MKEKIKVSGYGSLHDLEYGSIEIDHKKMIPHSKIIYDNKIDQYNVNGQWLIPYHRDNNNDLLIIEKKLKKFFYEIKDIKLYLIKKQKYEMSAIIREIEKNLLKTINYIKE